MVDNARSAARILFGVLLCVCATTATPRAEAPPTEARVSSEPRTGFGSALRRSFGREGRIAGRSGAQLESLAALQRVAEPGRELGDHMLFDELSRSVERSFRKSTRDAFEDFVLESTQLEQRIDDWLGRGRKSSGLLEARPQRVEFDFSLRGLMPGVQLRYDTGGAGTLRFRVNAAGEARIGYEDRRFRRAVVWTGFDGEDRFHIHAAVGF